MGSCLGSRRRHSINHPSNGKRCLLKASKWKQDMRPRGFTYGDGKPLPHRVAHFFLKALVSLGKNQPLKQEKPKWKSDVPLTEGQLRSKRDEFWETAPAFEGRKEIWDALRAAATASENDDYDLAQAIIDGALISLPNGTLLDSYDELGNRYQLPIYCLSAPINLIEEGSDSESPSPESEPINSNRFSGDELCVKFRMSTTCNDVKMTVYTKETIFSAKRKLANLEGVEPHRQRWFFSGRLLNDKMRIEDVKLQNGFVVQVIVSEPD